MRKRCRGRASCAEDHRHLGCRSRLHGQAHVRRGRPHLHRRAPARGRRRRRDSGEHRSAPARLRSTILQPVRPAQNIRTRGLDFSAARCCSQRASRLNARDIGLAARRECRDSSRVRAQARSWRCSQPAMNWCCRARPSPTRSSPPTARRSLPPWSDISGREVAQSRHRPGQAEGHRARHRPKAAKADILVTTGGASVGDHDFVQQALEECRGQDRLLEDRHAAGQALHVWPQRASQHVLGLPGNPVSALVCARLFLKPLIDALLGLPAGDDLVLARLGAPDDGQ